jgi:uncharacterized protein YcbK (DUF882 family)
MIWSRRRVLQASGAVACVSAAALLAPPALSQAGSAATANRRIALLNLHTGERLDIEYCHGGAYVPQALSAIEDCLRDFRTGDRHAMDPQLMDTLVDVAHALRVEPAFSVISGYRSPQTNAMLHEHSTGVAQRSLHMDGRAIDVRISGVECADLAAQALGLKRGGVGYYRASDFVHLDTGAVRSWKG